MPFTPPPNWPQPPAGWEPPAGWVPDPAWGPAPDGWNLGLETSQPPGSRGASLRAGLKQAASAASSAKDRVNEAKDKVDSLRTLNTSPASPKITPKGPDNGIEAAADRMGMKLGVRREIGQLDGHLVPGEFVLAIGRVQRRGKECLLAVTDRRLLFTQQGIVRGSVEDLPARALTTVAVQRKLTKARLAVTVAGNAEVWDMGNAGDCERIAEAIRTMLASPVAQQAVQVVVQAAAPAAAPTVNIVDQLRQIGELRDAGILTVAEFDAKKAELLSRM